MHHIIFIKCLLKALSMWLVVVFLAPVSAQDLSPQAQLQLKSLMEEKASRTPDQQKINSQIWYAYKMLDGKSITPEVSSLRVGVEKDANGFIKANITAKASAQLLEDKTQLGCRVFDSSIRYSRITASIP